MKILSAEYVLPISDKPIINGAIAVENDKIIAIGQKQRIIEKYPQAISEDFGKSVIMPGFINCHSHLELTVMRGFLDRFDDDFSTWLITLTKNRRDNLTDVDIETSAMLGAFEGVRAGVTCFGDIGRWGSAGFNALKKNGLRGVLFQETEFSPDNKTAVIEFENLMKRFSTLKESETNLVKVGISPHSPYTVSQKLFEKIADYSGSNKIPLTIHASESKQEQSLMENGVGFFADIYKNENVDFISPRSSTIKYLSDIGVLDVNPLLAHCVQVSESDIDLIKSTNTKIAHCPKSNAKFGHGVAPLESFLDHKIVTGLGTDSMASNNNCDLLEEARFATLLARTRSTSERFLHAAEIIKTLTLGGAEALGLENEVGSLEAGKQADLIVISLEDVAQIPVHDIYTAILFASSSFNVILTMVAGEVLIQNAIPHKLDENELKSKIEIIKEKMN